MAYQTHYVGDLRYSLLCDHNMFISNAFRAVNDDLIDTYQLKSLDGQSGK